MVIHINSEREHFRCFVSYSSVDAELANRLCRDLNAMGMPCWEYVQDTVAGRKVWAKIGRPIKDDDKMLTICSQNSLQMDGVPREIERALQKESLIKTANNRRKKRAETRGMEPELLNEDVLFPIRLDDYIVNEWQHEQKADVLATHVLDFSEWRSEAKYQSALQQLLYDIDPRTRWAR